MDFKQNRALSFLILVWVYAVAAGLAFMLYGTLADYVPLPVNLLICDVAATVIVFVFSVLFGNASVYDPYWSVQPAVILCAYAADGFPRMGVLRWILLAAVMLWAVRLTANWAYTFKGLSHQDWRYTQLKEQTGKLYPLVNFFGIHLVPTLIVYACVLPAVLALTEASDGAVVSLFIVGIALCVLAVVLQLCADTAMHRFRRAGTKGFIRTGLWKYSRHPNYLGEILMWWGTAIASGAITGFQWYVPCGAVLNTLLFLFISIPLAERHQASRKPGFDEYKKQTRMLLPVYKKQG